MFERRTLFSAVAGLSSLVVAGITGRSASAKSLSIDLEPRGTVGRLERLPTLDCECRDDFFTGLRAWRGNRNLRPDTNLSTVARKHFLEIMVNKGLDPNDPEIPLEKIRSVTDGDYILGLVERIRIDSHRLGHLNFKYKFEEHADEYLAEMDAYDKRGPGTVELNPDMHIPDYARHEFHNQPDGYVGSAFAGHIYNYGAAARWASVQQDREARNERYANEVAAPSDGRVSRVLDQGCGVGHMTMGLKRRFPDAEVWGIDVSAPMVRYAHMLSVEADQDVRYAQRLAEDSKFPDNHFDLVTSTILHHEIPADISNKIIAEAHRILRPGGVFVPMDFFTGFASKTYRNAYSRYREWMDHKWNNEVWRMEYRNFDFIGALRDAGFDVNEKGPPARGHKNNVLATKVA